MCMKVDELMNYKLDLELVDSVADKDLDVLTSMIHDDVRLFITWDSVGQVLYCYYLFGFSHLCDMFGGGLAQLVESLVASTKLINAGPG